MLEGQNLEEDNCVQTQDLKLCNFSVSDFLTCNMGIIRLFSLMGSMRACAHGFVHVCA